MLFSHIVHPTHVIEDYHIFMRQKLYIGIPNTILFGFYTRFDKEHLIFEVIKFSWRFNLCFYVVCIACWQVTSVKEQYMFNT